MTTPDDSAEPADTATADTGDTGIQETIPSLVINELMASNGGALTREDGTAPDWLEIYNAGDEDVDLEGIVVSDNYNKKDLHPLPAGLRIGAGEHLLLYASGAEDPADHELPFRLSENGEAVGLFTAQETPIDWVVYEAMDVDQALARLPDGGEEWAEMPVGTPGSPNVRLSWQEVALVASGATWSYDDSGTDQGTAWRAADFDDSAWATGTGPFGYGDSHLVTTTSYGDDANNKHPTTYFRVSFTLEALPGVVSLKILYDDGALVWVNGAEAWRDNLSEEEPGYASYASATVSDPAETTYTEDEVDAGLFVVGTNVVAVEVHQAGPTSSDLGFDLELSGASLGEEGRAR